MFGPAGTGRQDDKGVGFDCPVQGLVGRDAVSEYAHPASQPLERLDQIEGKAVEIVDQQDAAAHAAASEGQRTESSADAFRRVSSASACGSLS